MAGGKIAGELRKIYEGRGLQRYGLEAISQLQHATQAAQLAEKGGEGADMILAALLHDIGQMLMANPVADRINNFHENLGARWLRPRLGERVSEPVRLHVAAKRYLCAVDMAYTAALAPDSLSSLALQGGPMRKDEVAAFLAEPYAQQAVRLRRLDDRAKDPDAVTPSFVHFLGHLAGLP